jgi:predicted kinase
MLVGLPGSGKSYVAKEHFSGATILSSDDIREEMWGDANDQREPAKVFNEMERRLIAALDNNEDVVYDATNLVSKKRKALVQKVLHSYSYTECICVLVTCSIKECKRRQNDRDRKVPDEVIDRMARQFEVPYYNEGWHSIHIFNNGPKQNIDREHERLMQTAHDNPHHTTGSIGLHCTKVAAALRSQLKEQRYPNPLITMLSDAALHHDIGKRKCKTFTNHKGETTDIAHYYGHENLGAYLWLSGDKNGDWHETEFLLIGLLIQLHMKPYSFPNRSRDEWNAWCDKMGYKDYIAEWVWMIHEADKAGH